MNGDFSSRQGYYFIPIPHYSDEWKKFNSHSSPFPIHVPCPVQWMLQVKDLSKGTFVGDTDLVRNTAVIPQPNQTTPAGAEGTLKSMLSGKSVERINITVTQTPGADLTLFDAVKITLCPVIITPGRIFEN